MPIFIRKKAGYERRRVNVCKSMYMVFMQNVEIVRLTNDTREWIPSVIN